MVSEDLPEFAPVDAYAVHHAMSCAEAEAREREGKMPSLAAAIRKYRTIERDG
jgi:hypothetical protein